MALHLVRSGASHREIEPFVGKEPIGSPDIPSKVNHAFHMAQLETMFIHFKNKRMKNNKNARDIPG